MPTALRIQGAELGQLVGGARLVRLRPIRLVAIDAVDLHGDRQLAQRRAALGLVTDRARDLVVDGLLGSLGLLGAGCRRVRRRPLGRQVVGGAHRRRRLVLLLIARLVGGPGAAGHLALRIEQLGRGRQLVEVEIGADGCIGLAGADRPFQQLDHLGAQAVFQCNPIVFGVAVGELAGIGPGRFASRLPASSTRVTASGCRPGTAAATRLRMPATCRFSSAVAPRRTRTIDAVGFTSSRPNRLRLGSTIDPSRTHAAQRPDRARQLAFDRPLQVDVAEKIASRERVGPVEQLVADRPADRHALFRQGHAQPQRIAGRHHDGIATRAQAIGDGHGLQPTDQFLRVGQRQAGKQQRVGSVGARAIT